MGDGPEAMGKKATSDESVGRGPRTRRFSDYSETFFSDCSGNSPYNFFLDSRQEIAGMTGGGTGFPPETCLRSFLSGNCGNDSGGNGNDSVLDSRLRENDTTMS
jgi:hypothetical protein